jgi:hypothetical protein
MSAPTETTVSYLGNESLTLVLVSDEVYRFEPGSEVRVVHVEDVSLFREMPQFEVSEDAVSSEPTES